mmetsp:Transcript_11063/g.20106  ORF Transcript_11063/g.20106 Transcript_11063/m.20106 type:complete len:775 (-) Transcript_11063:26-2350(-)
MSRLLLEAGHPSTLAGSQVKGNIVVLPRQLRQGPRAPYSKGPGDKGDNYPGLGLLLQAAGWGLLAGSGLHQAARRLIGRQAKRQADPDGSGYVPRKERRRRREEKRLRLSLGPVEEPPPPTRETYTGPLTLTFEGVSWTPPRADPTPQFLIDPDKPPQRIKLPKGKRTQGRSVLKNATWSLVGNERVALVGPNGAGKTVQLRMVMGDLEPTSGVITRVPIDMRMGYLGQNANYMPSAATVQEELQSAAGGEAEEDRERVMSLLEWLGMLDQQDKQVSELSGGWRMRLALGKVLLQDPDLLLLDEPTNHLDENTVSFLGNALQELSLPTVVASHDRAFLASIATKVVEVSAGRTTTYSDGFLAYTHAHDLSLASAWKEHQQYKQRCVALEEQIASLAGKMMESQAARKRAELEALQSTPVQQPDVDVAPDFTLPPPPQPATARAPQDAVDCAIDVRNLTISYGGKKVLTDITFSVAAGDKIAIVGSNGAGKSALLTALVGDNPEADITGRLDIKTDSLAYFPQRLAERVASRPGTVRDILTSDCAGEDVDVVLQKLRLDGPVQYQRLDSLSGGERARVAFAAFLLHPSALLVFDEPTNHLDSVTRELLEATLRDFQGTALVVSHDSFFLREFATRVLLVENGTVRDFNSWKAYAEAVAWQGDTLEKPFLDEDAKAINLWASKRMTRIRRKYTEAELGLRRLSPKAEDMATKHREQRQRGKSDAVARLLERGVDPALLGPDFFPERASKKSLSAKREKPQKTRNRRGGTKNRGHPR